MPQKIPSALLFLPNLSPCPSSCSARQTSAVCHACQRPLRLSSDLTHYLLPYIQVLQFSTALDKNTKGSFPSLLFCVLWLTKIIFSLSLHLPISKTSKHFPMSTPKTEQQMRQHSANKLSENPESQQKPRIKTPTKKRETQKPQPIPIMTPNLDAYTAAWKHS